MTTALILVPLGGALWVWITPWPGSRGPGGLALLVALAELALWSGTALNFDFGDQGLQLSQQQTWFSDLGVSYHVAEFIAATIIGCAVLAVVVRSEYRDARRRQRWPGKNQKRR